MRDRWLALVEREGSGALRVLAPAVGSWSGAPREGSLAGCGSAVGRLRCLQRSLPLCLPEDAQGIVAGATESRVVAVEYGQELFRLLALGERGGTPAALGAGPRRSEAVLAEGHAVRAPTEGVFYRRPAPGARAFVEIGDRVRRGQAVGLIEVMKTFHQILFEGPGFPREAQVVEILADDGVEVGAGQALLLAR
jgi:acetyl-CoA carboxylase biotin carboxyl carrier protein